MATKPKTDYHLSDPYGAGDAAHGGSKITTYPPEVVQETKEAQAARNVPSNPYVPKG